MTTLKTLRLVRRPGGKEDPKAPSSRDQGEKTPLDGPMRPPDPQPSSPDPPPGATPPMVPTATAEPSSFQKGTRLGERLVGKGLITRSQLSEALLQQPASGKRLGALLVELGILDERSLALVLAEQADLQTADLRKIKP